ncbi:hypothetical protein KN10_1737 [Anoxybacillus flavithermus NBRC 109594]|uniref:Uncharacterized protein n=1 Tax=Anoxybacillus flavithermus NBRC 109594 TaxID=1315967 RepID=R4FCU6_9BACL|nr:hypothetical protein KN10_1737 [Anoxybacillus flavithermus NBRC 109594]
MSNDDVISSEILSYDDGNKKKRPHVVSVFLTATVAIA